MIVVMHNMLKQFYNYLARSLQDFFLSRNIQQGDKFHIQFEKVEQVENLYQSLRDVDGSEDFHYSTNVGSYNTFTLPVKDVKLIVAATIDGVSPDWLTHLRNQVNSNEHQFLKTAILFIHNTTLDSIIGGAKGLQKEGLPLHANSIIKEIRKKLKTSSLSIWDQEIIELNIQHKSKQIFEDTSSIFEYQNLLAALNDTKGRIDPEEYRKFGLFYDPGLSDHKGKELKNRLGENFDLFQKVDNIHNYGSPEMDLEKDFDAKGVGLLQESDWRDLEFKVVKASQDSKKENTPIEYLGSTGIDDVTYWERSEGDTKVKTRIRNIIVFHEGQTEYVQLEFRFDKRVSREGLTLGQGLQVETTGKRIKVLINSPKNSTFITNLSFKDHSAKFDFKIAVVDCQSTMLEMIKTSYLVKPKEQLIVIQSGESSIVINPLGTEPVQEELTDYQNNDIEISEEQQLTLVKKISEQDDDQDYILVNLTIQGTLLPLALKEESVRPVVATGLNVWKLKRENQENFQYKGENKLIQGTREYFARDDFRCNLAREEKIIQSGALFLQETKEGLQALEIDVHPEIKKAYQGLIQYFKVNDLLPSLAYLTPELVLLYRHYVQTYINIVDQIPNGFSLVTQYKYLIKVGTIERMDGERELLLTPLHPLNVAYQIIFNESVDQEQLTDELLKRLSPVNLLPYMYQDLHRLYKPVEQTHSPEWNYYVYYKLPRYNGSRNFVAKLVKEKIEEFVEHFGYLFNLSKQSPLMLNLINLGDCNEVLQGIFNYYVDAINNNPDLEQLIPIQLFIYTKGSVITSFEELSLYDDPDIICEVFGLKLENKYYSDDDLLNIFRDKVHFYMLEAWQEKYHYAHITFYQMGETVQESYTKMKDVSTGVSLGGLVSGVPSIYDGETYKTGFGTKFLHVEQNILVSLVARFNALALKCNTVNPFDSEECIVMVISDENRELINQIYESTHWVTFIDPKVNLNFFKADPNNSDLLIIHYSDQYTSSSGYDAITVTQRSKQYQLIIEEFLREKGIADVERYSPEVINLFNSVNGDWLLRLISDKGQFSREKLSILSAIKISLAYFYHPDIIWIPISLEEILRVSGGVGLKKSEGLFSTKNLGGEGSYSDDLLLVGIAEKDGQVEIYYYPVEVKIGHNDSGIMATAVNQVHKTSQLIDDHLRKDTAENSEDFSEGLFTRCMYRNFLIQLAIVSAEKMKLYDVWPEQKWDWVINGDIRQKLLSDDYIISHRLDRYIGKGAVISFKKGIHFRNECLENDVLVLELTEQDGFNNITPPVEDLKKKYLNGESDFNQDRLLYKTYRTQQEGTPVTEEIDGTKGVATHQADMYQLSKVAQETNAMPASVVREVIGKPLEILFGTSHENNQPVYWFPTNTDKQMHTNTGIIGTMGTGKTQFTKSVITQLYQHQADNVYGTPIGILIFDYKGDYIKPDFIAATNAKVLNLFHLPYNPLALYLNEDPRHLLPLHTAGSLVETIAAGFGLGVKQQTTLKDLIMAAYEKRGIQKHNKNTWNQSAPTIHDVYRVYELNDDIKKDDSLYSALNKLFEYEIFEPNSANTQSLFEVINGVTVINLSGYDDSIQNLVVAITLDIFYNQMQMAGHSNIEGQLREIKKVILVDEADNFLSKDFKSLKKILKEGREFGVGTILSTQLLSHFSTSDNEYANYILTWVVHNVSDISNKDVRNIYNTSSKAEEDNILNQIKKLQKHFSIVSIGAGAKPVMIRDKAFWELAFK